ncbi:MAG: hypothetical protein DRJ52_08285 [Thermoprotei archaeon]|nr:MAG: hypothetical protein DRJ52_08285 [Thermoprotei archaeon]
MSSKIKVKVILLVIDQLPGHWAEGVYVDEKKKIPPVNIKGYYERGLIPHFAELIDNGLWVLRPWNRGICFTRQGMRYLATGSYTRPLYDEEYWRNPEDYSDEEKTGFFEYAKEYYKGELKCATIGGWYERGYFYVPDTIVSPHCTKISLHNTVEWSDLLLWRNFIKPYMDFNPDFNLMLIYFPTFDVINRCPSYVEKSDTNPFTSKHSYMMLLDYIIGEIVEYLKSKKMWNQTYIIVASDHGYHLGCSIARKQGARSTNWCCGHDAPFDCYIWDFEKDRPTDKYSGGTRRVTFIVSGGALPEDYRGKIVREAEIIDVAPTIADILEVPYKCEGKSIFKMKIEDKEDYYDRN